MNKTECLYIILFLSLIPSGCLSESRKGKQVYCRVEKLIIAERYNRYIHMQYNDYGISSIRENIEKSDIFRNHSFTYTNGIMDRIDIVPAGTTMVFFYDDKSRLRRIGGQKNALPSVFYYNRKGHIVTQKIFFNKRPYQIMRYKYKKNLPVLCEVYDANEKLQMTHFFAYDNKNNPFRALGPMINLMEALYGYPPGNAPNNITSVKTLFYDSLEKVIKQTTQYYSYHYNPYNYPERINNKIQLFYECIDNQHRLVHKHYHFDDYVDE